MTVPNDIRRELARFCRSRRTRKSTFSPTLPTKWAPHLVRNPASETREPFTNDRAWEFVADLLEAGHEVEIIELRVPPGKTGYVLISDGIPPEKIYIKLQLGSGVVIGRSFHISIPEGHQS